MIAQGEASFQISSPDEVTTDTQNLNVEAEAVEHIPPTSPGGTPLNPDDTQGAWTVSTKRRLAPTFTLSRQDLGADSPRAKAASQELAASKKKGIPPFIIMKSI